jgi:hypothetical protein
MANIATEINGHYFGTFLEASRRWTTPGKAFKKGEISEEKFYAGKGLKNQFKTAWNLSRITSRLYIYIKSFKVDCWIYEIV